MGVLTQFGLLLLLGIVFVSCGEAQSFRSASSTGLTGTDWRAISPEGIRPMSLAISPTYSEDETLYMGLEGWDLGVFRSTDNGDNWREVYEGLRGSAVGGWVVISPEFATDQTLVAGRGNGGVVRSTDGGGSWSKVNDGLPRHEDFGWCCGYYGVADFAFSPSFANDKTVYVATWSGLYRSIDHGKTWQNVSPDPTDTWMIRLLVSPSFDSDHTIFVLAKESTGGSGQALYRSTDRGDTWRRFAPNLSVDSGFRVATGLVISPDFSTDDTLYAATRDGLLRSVDEGEHWDTVYIYDGITEGNFAPWVVLSPAYGTDATLFTSKVCGGVLRSTDRGETWEDVTFLISVPGIANTPGYHTCDPAGYRSLVFSPTYDTDDTVFAWTEVGIFQVSGHALTGP